MAARSVVLLMLVLAAPKEEGHPSVPTPTPAQRIFDRLIAQLPPHLKSDAVRCQLIVLDQPDERAYPTSDGMVRITRPMVESLLADKKRGEAALAFVLADE